MKLPRQVTIRVEDRELIAAIRTHRQKAGVLISRIGEDALRLFFARKVKQIKGKGKK